MGNIIVNKNYGCLTVLDLGEEYLKNNPESLEVLYKCKCKCGKIHHYDEYTILSKPKYCYYPVFISGRLTYSVKAANARYRKEKTYEKLMNVVLTSDQGIILPSKQYCELWNENKLKPKSVSGK